MDYSRREFLTRFTRIMADRATNVALATGPVRREPEPQGAVFLRPPGAAPEPDFLKLCTRCTDCLEACPHQAIRRLGPEFDSVEGTPAITITSPLGSAATGAATTDVSGTWVNLDPTTLAVTVGTISTTKHSDTSGTFVASAVALSTGANAITITGSDTAARPATGTATITRTDGTPSISITTADNLYTAADTIDVTGTISADQGARVEVG